MKKIINGKKYDTATAKEMATCDNGYCTNDFNYYEETLYKKKTGEFFLYGEGNANSKYAQPLGNNTWCGGCEIIPITEEKAKQWCEDHCSGDKYEEIFGEVEE